MTAVLLIGVLLLGALAGLASQRWPRVARSVAYASSAFVVILAIGGMVRTKVPEIIDVPWPVPVVPGFEVPLDLATSRPLAAIAFVVTAVTFAVQVYAAWYLADDDRYPLFAATVSLFSAAMLLVVHSGDLILTLIGWEVMGWCSYLLIGYWSRRAAPRRAAVKAFLVTRVADIGFVLGTIGLAVGAGTTNTLGVIAFWTDPAKTCWEGQCTSVADGGIRTILLVLLLIGVLGKSAAIPFQDWLPDAMEGPTPASALIHAATMVAAGTVVLAHIFPILAMDTPARWMLGIVAAATMVFAAVLAFGQGDLKRLLAWSTVSQVAIMLGAIATSPADVGPDAGLFHLWAHAIFKALLFLALGWLAVIAGGTSARALRGVFHYASGGLVWATIFGLVSLAGVPLFVGGLSKEHVLATAYEDAVTQSGPGFVVLCGLFLTVVLTAAYCTRLYLIVTAPLDDVLAEPAGSNRPASSGVRQVIAALAGLSVFGGLVLLSNVFDLTEASWIWAGITLLLITVGVVGAIVTNGDSDPAVRLLGARMARYDNGFGFDAAYRSLAAPVLKAARVAAYLDREVIDGYVQGSAVAATLAGRVGDRAHRTGRPASGYALVIGGLLILAVVGVVAWR